MDTLLFCILWFLWHNVAIIEASSSEEEKEENVIYTTIDHVQITETPFDPYLVFERPFSLSHTDNGYSANSYDNTVASTSNDPQYPLPCCELPVNFYCAEATTESDEPSADKLMHQSTGSLHYATETVSTYIKNSAKTISRDLSENTSFNSSFEKDKASQVLHKSEAIPNNVLTQITEYLLQKNTSEKRYPNQHLSPFTNTLDDVIEVIEADLKNNDTTTAPSSSNHVERLNTSENEKNESFTTNVVNNSNDDNTSSGYTMKYGELLLTIKPYDLLSNIKILTHVYNVMIRCTLIDAEQCKKGLNGILEMHNDLQTSLSFNYNITNNMFLKYYQSMHKSLACYHFSDETNSSHFLNRFSLYVLGLQLMLIAPTWYDIINKKKNQKKVLKKNVLNIDICKLITDSNSIKSCMSQCKKFRWLNIPTEKVPRFLAFTYVLLIPNEKLASNIIKATLLKYYKGVVLLKIKCMSAIGLWINIGTSNCYQLQSIINDMKHIKHKAEQFNLLLKQLIQDADEHVTSKLRTVEHTIFFLLFWLGAIYLECIGSKKHRITFDRFISLYTFQKFFKDCQSKMCIEEMLKYDKTPFFMDNINVLGSLFTFIYLRLSQIAVITIINFLNNLCDDLEKMKKQTNYDINDQKVFLLKSKQGEFFNTMDPHVSILKAFIQQRKKMQYIQSVKQLIFKINKDADALQKKALLFKRQQNERNKTILKEQCEMIEKAYEQLYNLLNKKINENSLDFSDDE